MRAGHLALPGGRVETRWWGPPPRSAPTLVFLHEGLGSAALWRDFPETLAAATGCGALAYSRLGYGGSDPCPLPRPLSFMHEEAARLPALLDAARVRDGVLVGHSDGGSIALIHAGRDPVAGLRGVVTLAAHVFCEPLSVRSIRAARERYLNGDLRAKLERHHGPNTDCAFWGWNDAWLHPEFALWNIEAVLPQIRVPVLAVQGEDDEYGTPAQLEAIARGAGARTLMLPDCGHAPHRDQPERTLAAIGDFVNELLEG